MGTLIEQSIKTLYQGVSRQPDPVRLPGQVEEADNILVSVVTGGFESRPASRHITNLTSIADADTPAIYAYSRDAIEQYMIIINNGDLEVYDLDGVQQTVNFPDGKTYLNTPTGTTDETSFSFVTIADFTIIANNNKTVTMATSTYQRPHRALINCRTTNTSTAYSINIKETATGVSHQVWTYSATTALSNTAVASNIMNNISFSGMSGTYTTQQIGETVVITGSQAFTIEHTGSDATYGPYTMTDNVPDRQYLPASAPSDYYIRVGQNIDGEQFGYWAKFDTGNGGWIEAANPSINNEFEKTTMPHFLVREANGTFTFRKGNEYKDRIAGDETTTPNPDFVGKQITAVVFHRNRLAFVSGENINFSQAGYYFTFWPDFATQSLDSDSFGLTASSSTVNDLKHAVGFRKSLFLTSNKAQFEVATSSAGSLTPTNASIDLSTTYLTEARCKPITLGNTLYFAAKSGRDAIVFEYTFDDDTLSNVAQDITLHALSYIPAPLFRMTGDPTNDTIMCLSDSDRSALYIYKMYIDGETKAQSAWSKWTYGANAKIKWMEVIDGELYMVLSRDGQVYFEKTFLRYELSEEKHPYQVSMDRIVRATGVYDSVNDHTTWTTPYPHNNKTSVVLSTDFPAGKVGEVLKVTYPTTTTIQTPGDYRTTTGTNTGEAILGEIFTSSVTFSKLFPRDPQNLRKTITSGRFQLRNITFNFKDTGFFRVEVTPEFRTPSTFAFTGRIVGSGASKIGLAAIAPLGGFKVPVKSNGKSAKIRLFNDTEKPMNITSIDYVGYYNEITRQG